MWNHIVGCVRSIVVPAVTITTLTLVASVASRAQDVPPASVARNANEVFAAVGARVPEFGGMFIDEESRDTLDVYVVGDTPGLADRLDAAINAEPELASARAAQTRIKLLPGQYTFLQLKQWHDQMSLQVLRIPGVVLTAVDQSTNRLLIAVEDPASESQIEAKLAALGVPRQAVNIETTSRLSEVPAPRSVAPAPPQVPAGVTLQSEIRPLVGGIEISYPVGDDSAVSCTLGFIATRGDVSGLVTASHCTKVEGGVDNTKFYQPLPFQETVTDIGIETVDPCFYLANANPPSFPPGCKPVPPPFPPEDKCAKDEACRYSDSAFLAQAKGVQVSLGFIARPLRQNTINWDPPDTFFQVVGEQSVIIPKTFVSWVGQISGWREGPVSTVCANETVDKYTLICQNLVNSGPGNEGDSGSPVFACIDDSDPPKIVECPGIVGDKISKVKLIGIKWGSSSTGALRQTIYSPIGSMSDGTVKGVQNTSHELGPLKKCTVDGC